MIEKATKTYWLRGHDVGPACDVGIASNDKRAAAFKDLGYVRVYRDAAAKALLVPGAVLSIDFVLHSNPAAYAKAMKEPKNPATRLSYERRKRRRASAA